MSLYGYLVKRASLNASKSLYLLLTEAFNTYTSKLKSPGDCSFQLASTHSALHQILHVLEDHSLLLRHNGDRDLVHAFQVFISVTQLGGVGGS